MRPINRNLKTLQVYLPAGMSRRRAAVLLLSEVAVVALLIAAPLIHLQRQMRMASVPELIQLLAPNPSPAHALLSLESYQPLVTLISDDSLRNTEQSRKAIIGLRLHGTNAAPAVPHLIPFLADADDESAFMAADMLYIIGEPSIPHLLTMLTHPNRRARELAAYTLARLHPRDTRAANVLARALSDEDDYVRVLAAKALSEKGATGMPYAGALRRGLADTNQLTRVWSALALWRINRELSIPQLAECARIQKIWGVMARRGSVTYRLGVYTMIESVNKTGHSESVTAFLENNLNSQMNAIDVLAENMSAYEEARQALFELGKSKDWNVRNYAIRQVWKRGHDPELAATMFMQVIRRELTPNPIASDSLQLSPAPIEPNWVVDSCLDSLAVMGPEAKAALPILKQLAPTSGNALEALKKIAPDEATKLIDKLKQEGKPVPMEKNFRISERGGFYSIN